MKKNQLGLDDPRESMAKPPLARDTPSSVLSILHQLQTQGFCLDLMQPLPQQLLNCVDVVSLVSSQLENHIKIQ